MRIFVFFVLFWPALALAEVFSLDTGNQDVVGAVHTLSARYQDTLPDIGRRHGMGYTEITMANPDVDVWLPGEGTIVTVPSQFVLPEGKREGLVINLPEYRVYFFHEVDGEERVATFPISIGKMDWKTPLGRARITQKVKNPSWYPPASIKREYAEQGRSVPNVVPPGPDNPLGNFAMRLSLPGYLIHGTNRPAGVGMRVTHGCIRMFPEDIEWLFPEVKTSMPVQLINQPAKFGWKGNALYFESHPVLAEYAGNPSELTDITEQFIRITADKPARIDWNLVDEVYREARGIPVQVGSWAGLVQTTADNRN